MKGRVPADDDPLIALETKLTANDAAAKTFSADRRHQR